MENKNNICKFCKHFHQMLSNDIVFIERTEICDKLNIDWPCQSKCEDFENKDKENE